MNDNWVKTSSDLVLTVNSNIFGIIKKKQV